MTDKHKKIRTVTLAYFSGTGCTEMVVNCFEKQFTEQGITVNKIKIDSLDPCEVVKSDLLIVLSPVYAYRLASIVEKWVSKLPKSENTLAAIISVSGGGEISPNTACRVKCRRFLIRKGYDFIYEKMITMPSNFAVPTEQELIVELINILPSKVKMIVTDILSGKKNMTHPKIQDRFIASIGKVEHIGARLFGMSIHASRECNQCGLCVKGCPRMNIKMQNGTPRFGFSCIWCLKCIYACPCKALSPRIFKFAVFKEGFDINKMR